MIKANELCPGDKSIKEAFVLYKERKANYHKKSIEIAKQVFNKFESESAMKERQSKLSLEEKDEDIPGFLNRLIKFLCVIPLMIYTYCFEKCFKGCLGFVSIIFSFIDKLPCFG